MAAPGAWMEDAVPVLTAACAAEVFGGSTANVIVIVGNHGLDDIKKALGLSTDTLGFTHEVIDGQTASQRGLLPPQR
jgi:hypothetical protein